MDVLGTVKSFTTDNRLIIRCQNLPDLGDRAFDSQGQMIGPVKKVFGPVSAPYASVSPASGYKLAGLKGSTIYYRGNKQNAKAKRRHRRD